MRETDFIRQNKKKWQEFEKQIVADDRDPEKLSDLFVEVTDDLSYSRTYYPNRSVRVYLNGVAQTVFQNIYKNKRSKIHPFKGFWVETLPATLWRVRRAMLWAAIAFVVSTVIGYVSSMYNEDFCALIMGDYYVEMSESNVEKGDPFAVYKDADALDMFFSIAFNNIRICFLVFVLGMLAGAGSVWVMLTNGIMFGAFTHFFVARGLLAEFSTVVMLHGTLELSMIVLSGAAGLTLGSGLLFPKSYGRLQSLVLSARRGVQLMVPCTIFLLIAAFIESWITRHTEAPFIIRASLVAVSAAIVVGYFVIYPWWRHKQGLIKDEEDDQLHADRDYEVRFDMVKTNGKIFTEVFAFFKSGTRAIVKTAVAVGFVTMAGYFLVCGEDLGWVTDWHNTGEFWMFDLVWPWNEVGHLYSFDMYAWLAIPVLIGGTMMIYTTSQSFFKTKNGGSPRPFNVVNVLNAATLTLLIILPWFAASYLSWLVALCCFFYIPWLLTVYVTASTEQRYMLTVMGRAMKLLKKSWGRQFGLFWVMLGLPWIALFSATSLLWVIIFQVIETLWMQSWMASETLSYLVYVGFSFFIMSVTFPLMILGYHLFYYNIAEISTAAALRKRISQIRFRTKAYGLEKE